MKVVASAPGKAFLLGEYAVLSGAPALVAALDRRARATVESAPGWSITARFGGGQINADFAANSYDRIIWHSTVPDSTKSALALLPAILQGMAAHLSVNLARLPTAHITLDTSAFFFGGTKLGLGSSAAATVALAGALSTWAGEPPPPLASLVALHREFQDGRGSGADIAASHNGGVVRAQPGNGSDPMVITPVSLPTGLGMRWLWTGAAADTRAYLAVWSNWRTREPDRARALIDRLGAIARTPWSDAASFVAVAADYGAALDDLDRASGLGIYAGAHATLRDLATTEKLAYKPCGAGGGDLGVALGADSRALTSFTDRARAAGIRTLPMHVDSLGLSSHIAEGHG